MGSEKLNYWKYAHKIRKLLFKEFIEWMVGLVGEKKGSESKTLNSFFKFAWKKNKISWLNW